MRPIAFPHVSYFVNLVLGFIFPFLLKVKIDNKGIDTLFNPSIDSILFPLRCMDLRPEKLTFKIYLMIEGYLFDPTSKNADLRWDTIVSIRQGSYKKHSLKISPIFLRLYKVFLTYKNNFFVDELVDGGRDGVVVLVHNKLKRLHHLWEE